MVVIEVNYLTGYVVEREDLTNSQLGKIFKKLEKKADKLVIYLDEVSFFLYSDEFSKNCLNYFLKIIEKI